MIFYSDLGGALYLWMSVSMSLSIYLCLYDRIVQIWLQCSISQLLIIWLSSNLAYLSTLGCRFWYRCRNSCQQLSSAVNSCQQLFFTSRSPKINDRGLLCKSLFSKMFWKLSGDEFWVLKLFCSSKTDWVTDLFSFSAVQTFELCFYLVLGSTMCPSGSYSDVIWHFS